MDVYISGQRSGCKLLDRTDAHAQDMRRTPASNRLPAPTAPALYSSRTSDAFFRHSIGQRPTATLTTQLVIVNWFTKNG